MIVILDYGMGNVGSIVNMLKKAGFVAILSSDPEVIRKAEKLILPGVGAFDIGMIKLSKSGLIPIIKEHALINKKPILGICLGMQLLGRNSEEGHEKGLGLIPFENKKFNFGVDSKLKIPHMGWSITSTKVNDDPLINTLTPFPRYYFVHSYHAVCDNEENILMRCEYGYPFVAAVKKENIYGVQFHPEKSHKFGMELLANFARRV